MGKDENAYFAKKAVYKVRNVKLGYKSNCYKNDICFVWVRRIHQQTEGNQGEMLVLKCKSSRMVIHPYIPWGKIGKLCANRKMSNEGLKTVFSTKLDMGIHGNAYWEMPHS